jgi:RHS repeat-associated protein
VSNGTTVRSYGYDANQNLTSESLTIDGLTMTAGYYYTGNDQLSAIVYPVLGRQLNLKPDTLGRPTSVGFSTSSSLLSVAFWPNGQIYDMAYAGGSRVTYGQNMREWPNSVTVRTSDGVARIASGLTYDVAGNLISVDDSVDASYNRKLGYDAINRLTYNAGPWGDGSASYDGAGNITSYVVGVQSRGYAYDAQNRLARVTTTNAQGSSDVFYSHDAYGNASPTFNPHFYDNANNLTNTTGGSYNGYDGLNTRVKTVFAGVTTYEFRSASGLLLAEWQKQSGYYDTLKEHVYVAGKEVAEQRTHFLGSDVLPPTLMFLQPDLNGSPIASTWAGGGLLFKENYQPYGSQINNTAVAYTQRAFSGHKQDAPDLVYAGGRYYNPMIGRFLSVDPQEADPSDLHSLNRYAYGNNNPYRYVDPDGRTVVDVGFLAVDAVKLGVAIYTGTGVGSAAVNLGLSAAGVLSPVPGVGQVLKGLRVAGKVVDGAKAADRVMEARGAESGVADEAGGAKGTDSKGNTNPYAGPVTEPVVVVDQKGNAIPVDKGQQVKTSPNGDYQQVIGADGKPTGDRMDRGGHKGQKDPRAQAPHGHRPGVTTTPDRNPHLPIN